MTSGLAPRADPPALPLVRFEGVSRRFGAVAAVDRLSLDVHAGEFFALLGPSGCGKTTLLRLLAGFETPDDGRIMLAGEDIGGVPPHRRPLNMMFQSYALFPHMSVAANVAFGLRQDGMPRREREARVAEMLALVRLDALAGRRPHQLSGGQRQRVALARALARQPRVLLLDEPLAALDRKLREETRFELVDLQARLGTTFIVVTHDQEEAMSMAHRIAVMDHGRIVQVGTPPDLYEQPNSRWVAQFVGDVNLIEGVAAAAAAGRVVVETAAGRRFAAEGGHEGVAPGTRVWLALRPEKLRLARRSTPDGSGGEGGDGGDGIAGRVVDIGYRGDMSVYKVRLDDGTLMRAAAANARRVRAPEIGRDEEVVLSWAADAAVVLTR